MRDRVDLDEDGDGPQAGSSSSSSSSSAPISYLLLFVLCIIPLLSVRWRAAVKSSPPSTSSTAAGNRVSTNPPPPGNSLPSFVAIGGGGGGNSGRNRWSKTKSPPNAPSMITKVIAAVRRPAPSSPSPKITKSSSSPLSSLYHKSSSNWFAPPPPPPPRKGRKASSSPAMASKSSGGGGGSSSPPSLPPPAFVQPPTTFVKSRGGVMPKSVTRNSKEDVVSMTGFLGTEGSNVDVDLLVLMTHIQSACKHIAAVLASPTELQASLSDSSFSYAAERDAPKPLDIIANNIMKAALRSSGKVAAIASEEEDAAIWFGEGPFVVVFDPLDGSRNIDASIPTGTIFGIYRKLPEADQLPLPEKATVNVMQRGERLVAAGYALYSSATVMCISVGSGLYGFTLDHSIGEFVYSHHDIRIPERGQIYSVNDARYFDWPSGLRRYIDNIRQGKSQTRKKYSARYICSLVADLHRTILYGGLAMNPRSHLRLVYEANPLSYLVEQGGGKGTDGKRRILEINPIKLHQRLPLFLGSMADIAELVSYGDVQQLENPGYEV
jgi:fructose-1,6-bisphosphatase I